MSVDSHLHLLLDMDRKTSAQRVSFRTLTQSTQANEMENLEWEPPDLIPLSISHQKESTAVLLGQTLSVICGSFLFSYSCWTGAAGLPCPIGTWSS